MLKEKVIMLWRWDHFKGSDVKPLLGPTVTQMALYTHHGLSPFTSFTTGACLASVVEKFQKCKKHTNKLFTIAILCLQNVLFQSQGRQLYAIRFCA